MKKHIVIIIIGVVIITCMILSIIIIKNNDKKNQITNTIENNMNKEVKEIVKIGNMVLGDKDTKDNVIYRAGYNIYYNTIIYSDGRVENVNDGEIIENISQKKLEKIIKLIDEIDKEKVEDIYFNVAPEGGRIVTVINSQNEEFDIQHVYGDNYSNEAKKLIKILEKY